MKKEISKREADAVNVPRLIVITVLFCLGAVIGSYIGAKITGEEDWLWTYTNLTPQQFFRRDSVFNLILSVIIFLGGFTSFGFAFAVALSLVKGFACAVPISAFVRLYGVSGYFSAAEMGSVSSVFSVFSLCILTLQAMEMSSIKRKGYFENKAEAAKQYALEFCVCTVIIIFGSAIDGFVL